MALGCALAQLGQIRLGLWALGASVPCGFAIASVTAHLLLRRAAQAQSQSYRGALALLRQFAPGLLSAVQSALDFQTQKCGALLHQSPQLMDQHLERTATRLFAVNLAERWHTAQAKRLAWAYGALGATLCVCFVTLVVYRGGFERLWQSVCQPQAWHLSEHALIGDLSLRYTYPAYTHAAVRFVPSSDGSIDAVEGTEVDIEVHAEGPVRRAWMELNQASQSAMTRLDAVSMQGCKAVFRLPLVGDSNYRFILDLGAGDALGDPYVRSMHAAEDAPPTVVMSMPLGDVSMRDNEAIEVVWRAEDDFNLQHAQLIVERFGQEPRTMDLWTRDKDSLVQIQADGQYTWNTASLGLEPGESVQFYVAAWDTDTRHGPKRGVSQSHKLTLYSARAHHEELVAKCRSSLDALTDVLGLELEHPIDIDAQSPEAWHSAAEALKEAASRTSGVNDTLNTLLAELQDDPLAQAHIRIALTHVQQHVHAAQSIRSQQAELLDGTPYRLRAQRLVPSAQVQQSFVAHLETDIVYLDDLLAVARIDEIKHLAKDLLTDQRHLKDLLSEMGHTQDPKLKVELQQGISALRQKMLDVLRKMSEIKQNLPGEYRNIEASSMLRLDEQLSRLDKQLSEGDLNSAAEELEQLANMVENMVQNLGEAQKQYGGERYDAMRQQLQKFADAFGQLEAEQQSLSQRSDALLGEYRQKTLSKMANNKEDFVHKARQLTHEALTALDEVSRDKQLASRYDFELEQSRTGLLDVDNLLTHQDFLEARLCITGAEDNTAALCGRMGAQNMMAQQAPSLTAARRSCARASQKTGAVASMLAQLFDDPDAVLSPAQKAQMDQMKQKQQALQSQAHKLSEAMQQMAEQMPLFGDESQAHLGQAGQQMQSAEKSFSDHALAQGAAHSRQAAEALQQLRQNLQQAAQTSGPGVPLPLGSGSGGEGEPNGGFDAEHQQDVAIPGVPNKTQTPAFRRDLMEAAKQKAPAYYEDAVRRYYNELIR